MTLTAHRWNRPTLLARLAANDAIDALAHTDALSAARDRLMLLSVGDRFEAGVLCEDEAIAEFEALRASARSQRDDARSISH